MASNLRALKDIPTVSSLYRKREIQPSTERELPGPNEIFNNKVCTVQYDITKLQVDAIVNAANSSLLGGGGVDGAIHRAAGSQLLPECRSLGGCDTGSAKMTEGYDLPCKKIIHAVGPVYKNPTKSEPLLRGCYRTSLQLAVENHCKSIAFSAISTGIYGYPSDEAARSAVSEVYNFLQGPDSDQVEKIVFCNFLEKDVSAYAKAIPLYFPPTEQDSIAASKLS